MAAGARVTWFQIWTVCWQVAVFLTPTLLGLAVLWLKSQFVTKTDATGERNRVDATISAVRQELKTEVNRLDGSLAQHKAERDNRWDTAKDKLSDHEGRLTAAEKDLARPPSRHQLNNALSVLQGGMHAVEVSMADLRRQGEAQAADLRRHLETHSTYIQALLEKHLK